MARRKTAKASLSGLKEWIAALGATKTEEDVKGAYAAHFGIRYDTSDRIDLYTEQALFEFKFDKNLRSLKQRAAILAQNLYYIHRLKYGMTDKPIPAHICVADRNEAFLTETRLWKKFYVDAEERYDWDLPASSPDSMLVGDLYENPELAKVHVFALLDPQEAEVYDAKMREILDPQTALALGDKKLITEDNFEEVFQLWNKNFGDSVRNGLKPSRYFVCDIREGGTTLFKNEGKVFFDFGANEGRFKKILPKNYEYFWSLYEKVSNPDVIRDILAKIDRLTDETMRRFHGEFFTPVAFARKALDYVERTCGKEWWKTGEYRLWDMAAGTGNLEYHLPADALPHCYLSSLYKEDVEHCQRLFPEAHNFQYDYLNDDVGNLFLENALGFKLTWKLPQRLREDLQNPKLKWVILINPPFATAQTAGCAGESKKDVSDTELRRIMHDQDLGETSRELFAQFLFRIHHEFKGKAAWFGLFSKLKYLNANNDQKLRDAIFHYAFERGFMFSSVNFAGTSRTSQFPVGFLVWNLAREMPLSDQEIELDVFSEDVEKIARKPIPAEHRDRFLSKWIERPDATETFPPLGSAIGLKSANKDARDRIAKGFLCSFMCKGNDFQNQNYTALLSGPYVSAGALSVTPENFEKAMVVHAVRRIPKANWINDRDQFMQPNRELTAEFIDDCAIWSIFSNSNETAAMTKVEYQGKVYQITNHLFPFAKSEVKKWKVADSDIAVSLAAGDDRFMARWLDGRKLSAEAAAVLEAGRAVYEFYFANLNRLDTPKFKISTWDAGWWQIRSALADQNLGDDILAAVKEKHAALKAKLLPQLPEYGFIAAEHEATK
ncbi:MAG: hypothetical protein EOL90_01345 [Spartobacteria bacterium]|nr:hypothetical protein [Spartobacteria bacterium]